MVGPKDVLSDAHDPGLLIKTRVDQVQSARSSVRNMPREAVRGYPVPIYRDGELFLAFPFFLRRGLPPSPPQISAPGWVIIIDVATGTKVSVLETTNDLTKSLGVHQLDQGLDMNSLQAAEREMYRSMGRLLRIAEDAASGVPADLQATANEFARLWKHLAHKPLMEHYRALNPAWFNALGL